MRAFPSLELDTVKLKLKTLSKHWKSPTMASVFRMPCRPAESDL